MSDKNDVINKYWYVVGSPWLASDQIPYIIAGNYDPHVGIPVVDPFDPEEWEEVRDDEPTNPATIVHHIVDLHNAWLERKQSDD